MALGIEPRTCTCQAGALPVSYITSSFCFILRRSLAELPSWPHLLSSCFSVPRCWVIGLWYRIQLDLLKGCAGGWRTYHKLPLAFSFFSFSPHPVLEFERRSSCVLGRHSAAWPGDSSLVLKSLVWTDPVGIQGTGVGESCLWDAESHLRVRVIVLGWLRTGVIGKESARGWGGRPRLWNVGIIGYTFTECVWVRCNCSLDMELTKVGRNVSDLYASTNYFLD